MDFGPAPPNVSALEMRVGSDSWWAGDGVGPSSRKVFSPDAAAQRDQPSNAQTMPITSTDAPMSTSSCHKPRFSTVTSCQISWRRVFLRVYA
jgi:hypothetical protein